MSRPRKIKQAPLDLRTIPESFEGMEGFETLFRQSQINQKRADPFNEEPLAGVLSPVLLDRATEQEREFFGNLVANAARTLNADQLESFFARVVLLRRNIEQLGHRNAYAYFGYSRYMEETGREPSKPELKAYLIARRETFRELPADEDGKGWTRLWRESGLATLAAR